MIRQRGGVTLTGAAANAYRFEQLWIGSPVKEVLRMFAKFLQTVRATEIESLAFVLQRAGGRCGSNAHATHRVYGRK